MIEELNKLTMAKLKVICVDESIDGYKGLKKRDLLLLVKTARLTAAITKGIEALANIDAE
jgi:hypothetical protein